jgi:hypothetical protein
MIESMTYAPRETFRRFFFPFYIIQWNANIVICLKGQCHEIFDFRFFYESVSPRPLSIPLGPFRIFSKIRGDIRKCRCTTGTNDTGGKIRNDPYAIFGALEEDDS